MKNLFAILFIFGASVIIADAQITSGGNYTIEKSVIAGGGATKFEQAATPLEGTIGQSAAGTNQQNAAYKLQPGFWTTQQLLLPTAAAVTVSGRVTTVDGRGIRNVMVTMRNTSGESRTVVSGAFGYFRFMDVSAGETYIISISAKQYTFSQPILVRSIVEDADDIIFAADNAKQIFAAADFDSPAVKLSAQLYFLSKTVLCL